MFLVVEFLEDLVDFLDQKWGKAQGRFVEEHEFGPGHEGPSHDHHLLFAAGQVPGRVVPQLGQFGEIVIYQIQVPAHGLHIRSQMGGHHQVLIHGQVFQHLAAFP